ncbi:hypothetical protein KYJ26_16950 [Bacillus sp. MCCB 382]|uniref:hypothetical protein n=1 Tax=Bacillus sp. MCCB 382 TaxID=2860197 RepID=UPI001C58E479|nr:hypothetical protein [Bacillus sp. MCCB 382]
MNNPITFGDLVRVNGYGNRVFQVESYYEQEWFYPDGTWKDRIFELFDVGNADSIEAGAEDLTLVADASQADEYLRANPAPIEPGSSPIIPINFNLDMSFLYGENYEGGDDIMNERKKNTSARELSSQEAKRKKQERKLRKQKIDACLDWMNYYKADGNTAKVAEIKQELAELSKESE